jgi:hypothetical protein
MYNHFAGDPHWTTARFTSTCCSCGGSIKKGEKIFYYPKGKHVYCHDCGRAAYEDFRAAAEDEYLESGPCDYFTGERIY